MVLTVCSTAMAETLTAESAVGTVGILAGREAMVVYLGGSIGKVAVATRNVGATDVNDYGTSFSAEDALDPDKNGLTDGWYVPSMEELVALSENLKDNDDKDSKYGLEWQVSETATLYVPATILIYGEYGGFYMSSSQSKSILAFIYDATKGLTKMVVDNQETIYSQFVIRPFHKLPTKNQCLFYTSSDGNVVTPSNNDFNVSIISNTYDNGQGVIIFDGDLTSIGFNAFYRKGTLTSVIIPASVASIGGNAFYECSGLASLTLAEGSQLETIGNAAFSNTGITGELTFPASLKTIGGFAFNGCSKLSSLTFTEGSQLETIGSDAFNSTAISGELTLPVSLKTIGDWVFNATRLTAVNIPASVTSIGDYAFNGCSSLATLTFAEDSQLEAIGGHAFSGTLISGELTLPASLKTIGESAFNGCSSLTKLTFAEGSQLKNIGSLAFAGTAISGELTLPASVTTIEGNAFSNCSLTKVYMSSEDLSGSYSLIFNAGAVIIVPAELYELYKNHFEYYNKVEVEPLSDWQEYTIAQIKAAMKTANTISDTDKTTIAGYISTIEDATTFDEATTAYYTALALIDQQKAFEEKVKGVLGDLGTGHTGPAIRVTGKNGKSIMLFELDKVEFVNIDVIGQGEAEATGIGNVRWIQLWEGGPKFAEYNLGATSATEFGGYYTWGGMYKNGKGITWDGTYNEGSSVLSGEADTATNLWGSNWRMPTIEDFNNLLANCNAEWTTIDGVNGCKFTGKGDYKYNSIFLPAAGSCNGYPDSNAVVTNQGDRGYYFTSTPKANNIGHALMVTSSSQYLSACNRNTGNSIRAVLNEE